MKNAYGKKTMMLLIVITLLLAPIFPLMSVRGQDQQGQIQVETSSARGQGRILRSYREDGGEAFGRGADALLDHLTTLGRM